MLCDGWHAELEKVTRPHNLGKDRMITLLDKQGMENQEQDKIMARIEEFCSELYDSDQAVTIQTDPKEVWPCTNSGVMWK